jgi:hypothetical protein
MKTSLWSCMLAATFFFIACSDNRKNESSPAAPAGMHALDLTRFGKPFSIYVPDTTRAQLEIAEQSSGALHVKIGSQFAISIQDGAADLALKKQDIQSDDVNRFRSIVREDPEGLIWESAIVQPEFHFLRSIKAGTSEYSCEDLRREDGTGYGKDAIETMYNSCKNIVTAGDRDDS